MVIHVAKGRTTAATVILRPAFALRSSFQPSLPAAQCFSAIGKAPYPVFRCNGSSEDAIARPHTRDHYANQASHWYLAPHRNFLLVLRITPGLCRKPWHLNTPARVRSSHVTVPATWDAAGGFIDCKGGARADTNWLVPTP